MNPVIYEDISSILGQYERLLTKIKYKTIFIAGATGMMGRYLVFTLMEYANQLNENERPTVFAGARNADKAKTIFHEYLHLDNFKLSIADIAEIEVESIKDVDYIVHAASSATPTQFKENPVGIIKANVLGATRLLSIAKKNNARFCFVSTMEIYGEVATDTELTYVTEDNYGALNPLDLRSAYPESKRMVENLCTAYGAEYGTDCVIARLSHTYGPGMPLSDTRVQTQFMKSALESGKITLLSDGSRRRTYTYIADACSAILTILLAGDIGSTYNIANSQAVVSIKQLAETVLEESGLSAGNLELNISNPSSQLWSKASGDIFLDCSKLHNLGWVAKFTVRQGINRTIKSHKH
jgi:dTDP-glucose 4,6-dehydratase